MINRITFILSYVVVRRSRIWSRRARGRRWGGSGWCVCPKRCRVSKRGRQRVFFVAINRTTVWSRDSGGFESEVGGIRSLGVVGVSG